MTNGIGKRADVDIITFGYLSGPPPDAHLTMDLRSHFDGSRIDPALRELSPRDPRVRDAVMRAPGVWRVLTGIVALIEACQTGPSGLRTAPYGPVRVALGCAEGRQQAPVLGMALAAVIAGDTRTAHGYGLAHLSIWQGWRVNLTHRDVTTPTTA